MGVSYTAVQARCAYVGRLMEEKESVEQITKADKKGRSMVLFIALVSSNNFIKSMVVLFAA